VRALLEVGAETGLSPEDSAALEQLRPCLQKDGNTVDRIQLCKLLAGGEDDLSKAADRLHGLVRAQEDEKARLTRQKPGSKKLAFGRQTSQDPLLPAHATPGSPPMSPSSPRAHPMSPSLSAQRESGPGPASGSEDAVALSSSPPLALGPAPPKPPPYHCHLADAVTAKHAAGSPAEDSPREEPAEQDSARPEVGGGCVEHSSEGGTKDISESGSALNGSAQEVPVPATSAGGSAPDDGKTQETLQSASNVAAPAQCAAEKEKSMGAVEVGVQGASLQQESHSEEFVKLDEEGVLKEGQLTKRPQRYKKPKFLQGTSSKERWFVLTASSLRYFQGVDSKGILKGILKGCIETSTIRSVEPITQADGATLTFEVNHDAGVLVCLPKSIQERNAWIEAIRSVSPNLVLDTDTDSIASGQHPKSILSIKSAKGDKGSILSSDPEGANAMPSAEDSERIRSVSKYSIASLDEGAESAPQRPSAPEDRMPVVPEAVGTGEFEAFLAMHRLEPFRESLASGGFTSLARLLEAADLDDRLAALGISLAGHRRKITVAVDELRGKQAASSS
jgi:hypothetical protein